MPVSVKLALAAMLLAATVCPAPAGEADEPKRFDRKIEQATAKIVAEKLGELRGAIDPDRKVDAITTGATHIKNDEAPVAAPRKTPERPRLQLMIAPAFRRLPPIVHNGRFPEGVDPVMTGSTGGHLEAGALVSALDAGRRLAHFGPDAMPIE